jgi:iron complex outermembrane recepter protein
MPCKVVSRRRNFLHFLAVNWCCLLPNRTVIRNVGEVMLLLAVSSGILCPRAFGQDITPTPQAANQPVATSVEVIVTGSNIPTAEEVGPQPVDTYRRDDIFHLGVRSATDFVQKLPMATGTSNNENSTTIGDGRTDINLRGLAPKETLVLQDGRRLATDGFAGYIVGANFFLTPTVDLNLFPIGLIDHIDILKDGASSIYGSDAIGGVVNVWLIHKFQNHAEVYFSYGNTNLGASNDQAEKLAYLLGGVGDDKTDIVVYAEYYGRDAIYNRDRDISSNANFTRFGGTGEHTGELDARSGDFAGRVVPSLPSGGDFVYQPQLNGGALTPTPHAFPNVESDPQYESRLSLPRGQQAFNVNALTPAMPPVDREYFYGSLDHKILGQYLELFADFRYVRGFWDGAWAPTPFTPDVFTDVSRPLGISTEGISVPIQNPFNPFTVPDYKSPGGFDPKHPETKVSAAPPGTGFTTGVHYAGLEAGLRTDKITTNNFDVTAGLRGNLGEFGGYFKTWQWESGFRYSEDDRSESLGGVVNNNALRAALLDTNSATAFNPFGLNQNSPAVIDKVFTTIHRSGKASLTLEDLKVTGDLFSLPAGPLSFAIGGEHRSEYEKDQPDALTASRQVTGAALPLTEPAVPPFLPTNGSRDVWSLYWEVRVPVTSPSWNCYGLHSLELGYQERFDHYSDFGSTERPKFLFRWQPIDSSLTLRGTYSEAYHAPALAELYTSQAQISVLVEDPAIVLPNDPLGRTAGTSLTPPNTELKEPVGGNPNLKPEVAYEWTYGGVWSPKFIKGLTLSADFYHIDLRNGTISRADNIILFNNFISKTGTLPNGAPKGGTFSDLIQRDPVTGAVLDVHGRVQNRDRVWTEGLDYAANYQLDTSIFGHGNLGTFTFTVNGNYLDRFLIQEVGPKVNFNGRLAGPRIGVGPRNRWYASLFYDFGGLDTGLIVHYVGQYWADLQHTRKIGEWTTLDLVVNYTFHLPPPFTEPVPGYAKDASKNAEVTEGEDKKITPVSTAEYSSPGWRAWLNNTTITLGMNNVFDQDPPLVVSGNGYDQRQANIRGRVWYVALKKRF